jgi:putative endonuclease
MVLIWKKKEDRKRLLGNIEEQGPKKNQSRRRVGQRGEDLAFAFLKQKGYKILERNFKSPLGEIDLIARDGRTIVFVEVKARSSSHFGSAKGAVDLKKQRKLSLLAVDYLKRKSLLDQAARFDVVAIEWDRGMERVELVRNAFDLACQQA